MLAEVQLRTRLGRRKFFTLLQDARAGVVVSRRLAAESPAIADLSLAALPAKTLVGATGPTAEDTPNMTTDVGGDGGLKSVVPIAARICARSAAGASKRRGVG